MKGVGCRTLAGVRFPRNYREAAQENGKLHRWLQLRLRNRDIHYVVDHGQCVRGVGGGEVELFVGAVAEALGEVGVRWVWWGRRSSV